MKTREQVLKLLKEKKYSFEHVANIGYNTTKYELRDNKGLIVYNFSWSKGNVPFCCGMTEIGSFNFYDSRNDNDVFTEKDFMILLQQPFQKFLDQLSLRNKKNYNCVVYNLNYSTGCVFMRKFIHTCFPKQFKRVAVWYNTVHEDHKIEAYIQNLNIKG